MTSRTSRLDSGLTLLEVLASAMIFAMVMTVLIGTSSTAVHNVGQSARRLEANLVADAFLAELEIQMKQGIAPEIEESESVRDVFSIRMLKTDLVPDPQAAGGRAAPANPAAVGGDATSMLAGGLPEVAKHLKRYDIEVSWFEQNGPQTVTRTTFAFDWQTAAVEYSDLFERRNRSGIDGGAGGDGDESGPGGSGAGGTTASGRSGGAAGPDLTRRRVRIHGRNARLDALRRGQEQ